MSLLDLYARSLQARAHTPALEYRTPDGTVRELSFAALDTRSTRLAAHLRTRGLTRGDRLAFCLSNRLAVIDLWLACVKLGVIVVPINVLYKGREIAHIVGDAKPTAVVTTPDRTTDLPTGTTLWNVEDLERAAEGLAETGAKEIAEFTAERCDADTPAAIIYTSGTTGAAKGAVLTHGNFVANASALVSAWGISHTDRYLAALPLFHVHGLGNGVQCWLASGCHMRLEERFDRDEALDWFDSYRPTLFFGVPTMYVRLLEAPAERARAIGALMRLFVSGSAPLPAQLLEAFRERFGHVILERYGMTETLMNTSNPLVGERRAGSVGLPLPMTEVEVRDPQGTVVPDAEVGELWVRGPNVCQGYWQRPDATAAAFVDGWFRTGDIGVRSADGYITLQGRRSDLIISGGFNIYPREIEELLLSLPGVREAAVTGESDPVRGEVPVAYVVGDASLDLDALADLVRAELASFKLPRRWVRLDALPRTALGKVQKHLLSAKAT
ncbi:MAG: class I adenylate-forming enzyme family protein [Gemmatimonadaceae bacterium]